MTWKTGRKPVDIQVLSVLIVSPNHRNQRRRKLRSSPRFTAAGCGLLSFGSVENLIRHERRPGPRDPAVDCVSKLTEGR